MHLLPILPITEYCDRNNLSVRQRLQLFAHVGRAVQHAHQKGIIHRDIKPSNVLVTLHDGKPVPKIIDFGIAKALNQQLTDKTLYTRVHQAVGTLAYMSPEQAELSGLDIDTRADIYGLGVLLYELLTGTPPFDPRRLEAAAFHEACRIICEEDPPKASTRVSSLGASATAISSHRQTDPLRLRQLVRGDLDWILMKSLDKDRTRRYGLLRSHVSGCSQDIPLLGWLDVSRGQISRKYVRHRAGHKVSNHVLADRFRKTGATFFASASLVASAISSCIRSSDASRSNCIKDPCNSGRMDALRSLLRSSPVTVNFAKPKSVILGVPSLVSRMFCGFRSR
jgi:serine/threonine protein kinase